MAVEDDKRNHRANSPPLTLDFAVCNLLEETAAALSVPSPSLMADAAYLERVRAWHHFHDQTHKIAWTSTFHVLDETPLMPCPRTVSVQITSDPRYRSEGRFRQAVNDCYFCYTLAGEGRFQRQGQTDIVLPGQGFLTEPNDLQSAYFYPADAHEPWRFLAFTFVGLPAQSMVRALTKSYGSVYTLDPQTPILKRLLSFESGSYALVDLHAADAAALVLDLLMTLTASARMGAEADATTALVRKAIRLAGAHLEDNLSVERLAEMTGASREHLARAFRRRLGLSPRQFLQEQKMRYACYLIKEMRLPIKHVATRLGYTTYANFFAAFRQVIGMTPHEFRLRGVLAFTSLFPRDMDLPPL